MYMECNLKTLAWGASCHTSTIASKLKTLDSAGVPLLVYLLHLTEKLFSIFLNSLCICNWKNNLIISILGLKTVLFLFFFPSLCFSLPFKALLLCLSWFFISSYPLWIWSESSLVEKCDCQEVYLHF